MFLKNCRILLNLDVFYPAGKLYEPHKYQNDRLNVQWRRY